MSISNKLARSQHEREAAAVRSVSILGATGSIGASTVDLLEKERASLSRRGRHREQECRGACRIARKVGARFAAIADPKLHGELKDALAGSGIETGAGDEAIVEAAARPADWVMAAITGADQPAADAGCRRARRHGRARQQGMSRLRRRLVHAPRGREGRHRVAGRFRAQRALSGDVLRRAQRSPARDPDGIGRSVPRSVDRDDPCRDTAAGAQASELVDGREGHDQFRDTHEQGPGAHRGTSSVRDAVRADRHPGASAIDRARYGRIS